MVEANRAFGQAAVRCLPQPRAHSGPNNLRSGGNRCRDCRNLRLSKPMLDDDRKNRPVNLARLAWLITVLACLVAVLILVLQGYLGYAGVTFAVALAAALNLV